MAENSGISWTDHTFNPWMGCTKVSPACKHCYAERDMDHRYGKVAWGPSGTRVLTSDANWKKPVKWDKQAYAMQCRYQTERTVDAPRPRVFCASLADVFEDWMGPIHDHKGNRLFWSHSREPHQSKWHWIPERESAGGEMPVTMDDVRRRLFALIDATPCLDWLLLTKRPENIRRFWVDNYLADTEFGSYGRSNAWLGTTVENQVYADKRIPELLECRDLSPVLFLSCEPLLGPVDLRTVALRAETNGTFAGLAFGTLCNPDLLDCLRGEVTAANSGCLVVENHPSIDWVIAGGESGPEARPSHPDWFLSLRDQCDADVPFHFKQMSEYQNKSFRDFDAFPRELQVREFPNA